MASCLFINGVEIYDADITVDSLTDKLTLINSKSEETGVTASAYFETTFVLMMLIRLSATPSNSMVLMSF